MNNTIGDAAGLIWAFLNENGPSSITKITTETGIGKNDVQRAIGWLAREEKINIELVGRTETVSLV
ncbi:MAG: winged helix-turn-helix domain-containing protein [Methylococcales bacterium]|nr:winged helix-turn-helix domain-containing protein [Methylococcales bacterium]